MTENIVENYPGGRRSFGWGYRHGHGYGHGHGHYGYGPGGWGWYGWPVYPPYYEPIYVGVNNSSQPTTAPTLASTPSPSPSPTNKEEQKIIITSPYGRGGSKTYWIIGLTIIALLFVIIVMLATKN